MTGVLSVLRSVSYELDVMTISSRVCVKRQYLDENPKCFAFWAESESRSGVRVRNEEVRLKVYFTVSKYFLAFE